jgi:hypothetical protein
MTYATGYSTEPPNRSIRCHVPLPSERIVKRVPDAVVNVPCGWFAGRRSDRAMLECSYAATSLGWQDSQGWASSVAATAKTSAIGSLARGIRRVPVYAVCGENRGVGSGSADTRSRRVFPAKRRTLYSRNLSSAPKDYVLGFDLCQVVFGREGLHMDDRDEPAPHASTSGIKCPCTSVRRMSRPLKR